MTDLPFDTRPRPLGPSGISVFPLAYGCWRFAGTAVAEARAKIETALGLGITLIDTADIYGWTGRDGFGTAEALLGQVFAEAPDLREAMVLSTKGGIIPGMPYNSTADYLVAACEASLTRLRVERIDLYQIHRPDFLAHPEETAAALTRLRAAGKIVHAGVSNFTVHQFEALQAYLDFPLVNHQPEFSAWELSPLREGLMDQSMARGLAVLAWSPLAGGALATGKAPRGTARTRDFAQLMTGIDALAKASGTSRTAVALAFLLAHPGNVIPILGTQTPERLKPALDAFKVGLTRSDWYDLVEASEGRPLP